MNVPSETPNLDRLRDWLREEVRPPSVRDPQGVRRSQMRPRARLMGRVGGLGFTGDRLDLQYSKSHRGKRSYMPIFERNLDGEYLYQLEMPGPNGRYVDWREVVR